jgi:hypothetical protein
MKTLKYLFCLVCIGTLVSCIQIYDEIILHQNGSGTFKYNINLSDSKIKVKAYLALDSLGGEKVPSIQELKSRIESFRNKLELKEGISNVSIESNFEDFIFKLKCDFVNVDYLQKGIKQIITEESKKHPNLDAEDWLIWDGNKLIRSIPDIAFDKTKAFKEDDEELMKTGVYTSITRFDHPILKHDNPNAKVSPSKNAIMIQTNIYALFQNFKQLENTIYVYNNPIQKEKEEE